MKVLIVAAVLALALTAASHKVSIVNDPLSCGQPCDNNKYAGRDLFHFWGKGLCVVVRLQCAAEESAVHNGVAHGRFQSPRIAALFPQSMAARVPERMPHSRGKGVGFLPFFFFFFFVRRFLNRGLADRCQAR